MNGLRPSWLLLAASAVVLVACSDDTTTTEPQAETPKYVMLLDDDSAPDQVQGEPGAYAISARGSGTPPLAVMDVPEGFSNLGFWMVWPSDYGSAGETACRSERFSTGPSTGSTRIPATGPVSTPRSDPGWTTW